MKFEIYPDKAGELRWRMRAANHQIIAVSGEGYKQFNDCQNAIALVQRGAVSAEVVRVEE